MSESGEEQGALIEGVYKLKIGSRIYYMQANKPGHLAGHNQVEKELS